MDRFSPAIDLSTSESKVLRSNPRPGCKYFVSFDHFKIDSGCIFTDIFFLGFPVDRFGVAVDLST